MTLPVLCQRKIALKEHRVIDMKHNGHWTDNEKDSNLIASVLLSGTLNESLPLHRFHTTILQSQEIDTTQRRSHF